MEKENELDENKDKEEEGDWTLVGVQKRKRRNSSKSEPEELLSMDLKDLSLQKKLNKPKGKRSKPQQDGRSAATSGLREKNSPVAQGSSKDLSNPGPTIYACRLNTPGSSVKDIHVDQQSRHVIQQCIGRITTAGFATLEYLIRAEGTEGTEQDKILVLKSLWSDLDWMTPGMIVNIIGVKEEKKRFTLDRGKGFLVVEPDKLISATNVMSQLYCDRKVALTSRFYLSSADNTMTFRGILAHELICQSMLSLHNTTERIAKCCDRICERKDMLEKAYGTGMTEDEFAKIKEDVVKWVERFLRERYNPEGKLDPKYQNFQFTNLEGIEDNIWNPTVGLKGKIDATVQIQHSSSNQKHIVPLEFKTGSVKSQKRQQVKHDHIGQVSLYTLMMINKFGKIDEALLYYISDDSLSVHPYRVFDLQNLILLRNKFIRASLLEAGEMPNLPRAENIEFDHKCHNCDVRTICTERTITQNREIPFDSYTNTEKQLVAANILTDGDMEFFGNWWKVINLETEEIEKTYTDKYVWTKTPEEREKAGACFANLRLIKGSSYKNSSGRWTYLVSLRKRESSKNEYSIPFQVEDHVVFSSNVEPCINYGVVSMINENEITLSMDQPLHKDYAATDFTYCVDRVNATSPIANQYVYLIKLMENTESAERLRQYIIYEKQPKFSKIPLPIQAVQDITKDLNAEQKRVITKAFSTDSFLFVKGVPGSGKTTTIVSLVRALVETGKTVLITAYTGTALENILVKYKKYRQDFIKISSNSKIDANVMELTTKEILKSCSNISEVVEAYNKPVVATTLLSLKHAIFKHRRFDYCIVDEASQALPSVVFGALNLCDKYIMFGDPNQLPPVIQSARIKEMRVAENFFVFMAKPMSTVNMNIQYRMNGGICLVSNALTYNELMRCSSPELLKSYIPTDSASVKSFLQKVQSDPAKEVLRHAITREGIKAVVFLDTTGITTAEKRSDESIANETEKTIAMAITRTLTEGKIEASQIGIIAPYRAQVSLLRKSLKQMSNKECHNIEVNTVDQYQGREMEVVICSFTKSLPVETINAYLQRAPSNDQKIKSYEGILEDNRRLNVALTRARTKVVLIGDQKTLQLYKPFKKLFEILQPNQFLKLTKDGYDGLEQLVNEGNIH